jgi:multidrug efflux pump subunit AcrA (membrane-fusion protein)
MPSGPRPRVAASYMAAMLLAVLSAGCKEKQQASAVGPPDVEVTEVTQRNVPVYNEWVAQLNGRTNAQITPRVQGYLLVQNYRNGFFVRKGQLLYEIDPRAFEVAITQAKGRSRHKALSRKSSWIRISPPRPRTGRNWTQQKHSWLKAS